MRRLIQRLETQANRVAKCSMLKKEVEITLLAKIAAETAAAFGAALSALDKQAGGTLKLDELDLSPELLAEIAAREGGK